YLFKPFRLLLDLCQLLLEVFDLPLQGRERCLFELPVALPIKQGALFQLERMALLLHAELDLTLILLKPVALLQCVGHSGITLARLLKCAIGCGNAGSPLQKSFSALDFLLEFLLALACAALLKL